MGREKWKKNSLRNVGRTHGHSGDFILCPMLCIALDRQQGYVAAMQKLSLLKPVNYAH